MHVYIYTHICKYIYIHTRTHVYIVYLHMITQTCCQTHIFSNLPFYTRRLHVYAKYSFNRIYIYTYMHIYTRVWIHAYVYTYANVYKYATTYTYTHYTPAAGEHVLLQCLSVVCPAASA